MEETWRLLHPWRCFLRGLILDEHTLVLRATLTDSNIFSQDGKTSVSHIAGLRHSLLLLLLLNNTNAAAFKSVLEGHLGLQSCKCHATAGAVLEARLELILDADITDLGTISDMLSLFFSTHAWEANWSVSFKDTATKIVALGNPDQDHTLPVAIHIRLPVERGVSFETPAGTPVKDAWTSIAHRVGQGPTFGLKFLDESQCSSLDFSESPSHAADERSSGHFQCHGFFHVSHQENVVFEMHPLVCAVTLPNSELSKAAGLVNSQTAVTMQLGLAELAHDSDVTQLTLSLGRILVGLLPTSARTMMLGTLRVMREGNMVLLLGRLWSALAVTQSVKRVEISIEDDQPTWSFSNEDLMDCALALFSKHGQSSITEVSLDELCVTLRDADAVSDIVNSSDPTTTRHQHQGGKENITVPNPQFMLKAGAIFYLLAMQEREDIDPDQSWVLHASITGARVIANDGVSDDVNVLVPGYGLCRMKRAYLHLSADGNSARSEVSSLSLTLDARWQEMLASASLLLTPDGHWKHFYAGMGRFIQAIGESLISLTINMHWPPEACVFFSEIMHSCPKLTKLGLHQIDFDSTAFLESYREGSLCLRDLECSTVQCSLRPLAAELSDPLSRLYHTLESLVCECSCEFVDEEPEWLGVLYHMLESNRMLRRVVVCGHLTERSEINDQLKQFSGELAVESLPLQHRLAFLTTFQTWDRVAKRYRDGPRAKGLEASRLASIGKDSITRVFEFAGSWVMNATG